jgi:hypothetical protein
MTDFECSLHLESLTGVWVVGVGSDAEGNPPSEESLDKWTRPSGNSSFTEWRMGGWTLDISEGWDKRIVDADIRVAISPNALYLPGGSTQWWPSLSRYLNWRMDLSISPDSDITSSSM